MPVKHGVDWRSLEHAYGSAEDVPEWLEKVANARGRLLHEAFGELCSRVLHQGTIYSASPPAVEAIVEMVRNARPPVEERRAALLELLAEFAAASRKSIEDGRAIPCCAGGDPEHGSAIKATLENAQPLFEGFLNDANVQIRCAAVRVLAAFPNTAASVLSKLEALFWNEADENVRGEILAGMSRSSVSSGFVERALPNEKDPHNRFWLYLAKMRATPDDAVVEGFVSAFVEVNAESGPSHLVFETEFLEALAALGEAKERQVLLRLAGSAKDSVARVTAERLLRSAFNDRRTGWGDTSFQWLPADGSKPALPGLGSMALRAVGLLIMIKLFPALMRWKLRRNSATKRDGVARIEYYGLQGTAPEMPERLSEEQTRILQALADNQAVWTFRTNLWELFGLPESSNAMRAYIIARTD